MQKHFIEHLRVSSQNDITKPSSNIFSSIHLLQDCNEILQKRKNILQSAFNIISQSSEFTVNDKIHSVQVALVCLEEMNLDFSSIICALLHLIPEKTNLFAKYRNVIDNKFIKVIIGVQRIKNIKNHTSLTKILLQFIGDIRIILIRIAEKLVVMRKLYKNKSLCRSKVITETKSIYLPLTNRLGLNKIHSELDDLCLKYSCPKIYHTIAKRLNIKKNEREQLLNKFSKSLEDKLKESDIKYKLYKRAKSMASIWNKIKRRSIPFKEIYDIYALRIVLDLDTDEHNLSDEEQQSCWEVYKQIENMYKINKYRTRDWLTHPKSNGYEALHITVKNKINQWVEIQIRTNRMNEIAERGNAAHWKYKNDRLSKENVPGINLWLDNIKKIIETKAFYILPKKNPDLLSLYKDSIYIMSGNQYNLMKMPLGSTFLDFANMHNIAPDLQYGKVNSKIVPLTYRLKNGDFVDIKEFELMLTMNRG